MMLTQFARVSLIALAAAAAPAAAAQEVEPRPPYTAAVPNGAPMSFADLIEEVSPAVVSIDARGTFERRDGPMRELPPIPPQFREFFERFEQEQPPRERRSQGSGFFISADGHIVTNNHVIDGADEITVALKDGRELEARVIGTDAATDIAVLKVEGEDFAYVTLDADPEVRVGDWVVAVGNPFGLGGTATAGIISAMGRPIGPQAYTDFLQIDAPINRGNSGGPAFDLEGNVVGVNSAIFSPTGGNVGIGFAIPSDLAASIVDQLLDNGEVRRGYLGVQPQTLTAELAEGFGLDPELEGVAITTVVDGTPAEDAGLRSGDVVTHVEGERVTDARELTRRIGAFAPGERVRLTVLREGDEREFRVRLAERPTAEELAEGPSAAPGEMEMFGMALEPADEATRERFGVEDERGLLVTAVREGSEAADKGVRAGDLILEAGGRDVTGLEDFRDAAEAARERDRRALLLLVASRNGATRYVALQFDGE